MGTFSQVYGRRVVGVEIFDDGSYSIQTVDDRNNPNVADREKSKESPRVFPRLPMIYRSSAAVGHSKVTPDD
jgi:hypothetical protein